MSPTEPTTVVFAADSRFVMQLAVALTSLARHATSTHRVFVLHDGFGADMQRRLALAAGDRVDLEFVDARSDAFAGTHRPAHLPAATLFRLRVDELLPSEVTRAVYLDADVVVRRSLAELWRTDLAGRVAAAVRDAVIPWAAAPYGLPWSDLGIAPETPYYNSGIMVIDVDAWREQSIRQRALDLLRDHRFLHADQCALNALLAGDWARLEPVWNLQTGHLVGDDSLAWVAEPHDQMTRAVDDPAIVHFTHGALGKPWELRCTNPYRDGWFEELDRTPWTGWRPHRRSRREKFLGRLRKAGAVLAHG